MSKARARRMSADALRKNKLGEAAQPRYLALEGDVAEGPDGVRVCGIFVRGDSLKAHLEGCRRAFLFAATLGGGADRLISRESVLSVAEGYELDLLASQAIEDYCDAVQERLAQALPEGLYLRPRFSPGYGDAEMGVSKDILTMLDAQKRIGLCCTEQGMLTPVKSVTAFIGITRERQSCHIHKCAACPNTGCAFRKEN